MTDKELVLRKIAMMREHLDRVRRRRPESLATLQADVDMQDALVLSLLVALQEAIDVAFHIAADEGWGLPPSNAAAFGILGEHGVIDGAMATELATTVRIRNRIAHGYATLDLPRVWAELPDGLTLLDAYAKAVVTWLA